MKSKKCPFCAEEIEVEAIKCKHCGKSINTNDFIKEPDNDNCKNIWVCKRCKKEVENNFDVCWNCGADRAGSLEKETEIEFNKTKKENNIYTSIRNNKYPALDVIILLIKLIAILNLFGWILISIKINDFAVILDQIGLSILSNSWVLTLLLGLISSIFIWGAAESKQVIIDIESNTRKSLKDDKLDENI